MHQDKTLLQNGCIKSHYFTKFRKRIILFKVSFHVIKVSLLMWFSLSLITSQSKLSLNSEANAADQWKNPFLVCGLPPLSLPASFPAAKDHNPITIRVASSPFGNGFSRIWLSIYSIHHHSNKKADIAVPAPLPRWDRALAPIPPWRIRPDRARARRTAPAPPAGRRWTWCGSSSSSPPAIKPREDNHPPSLQLRYLWLHPPIFIFFCHLCFPQFRYHNQQKKFSSPPHLPSALRRRRPAGGRGGLFALLWSASASDPFLAVGGFAAGGDGVYAGQGSVCNKSTKGGDLVKSVQTGKKQGRYDRTSARSSYGAWVAIVQWTVSILFFSPPSRRNQAELWRGRGYERKLQADCIASEFPFSSCCYVRQAK